MTRCTRSGRRLRPAREDWSLLCKVRRLRPDVPAYSWRQRNCAHRAFYWPAGRESQSPSSGHEYSQWTTTNRIRCCRHTTKLQNRACGGPGLCLQGVLLVFCQSFLFRQARFECRAAPCRASKSRSLGRPSPSPPTAPKNPSRMPRSIRNDSGKPAAPAVATLSAGSTKPRNA